MQSPYRAAPWWGNLPSASWCSQTTFLQGPHRGTAPGAMRSPWGYARSVRYLEPHDLSLWSWLRGLPTLNQKVGFDFPQKVGTFGTWLFKECMPFGWVSFLTKNILSVIIEWILFCAWKVWVHTMASALEGRSLPDWNVGKNKANPHSFPPAITAYQLVKHTRDLQYVLPCSQREALLRV